MPDPSKPIEYLAHRQRMEHVRRMQRATVNDAKRVPDLLDNEAKLNRDLRLARGVAAWAGLLAAVGIGGLIWAWVEGYL